MSRFRLANLESIADVWGVSVGDDDSAPQAPLRVQFERSSEELLAREPTESKLVGHADGMIVQREQVPGPGWQLGPAEYTRLLRQIKLSNPTSDIFGGHYSRVGMPWNVPVSPTSLAQGIRGDIDAGLDGSLVFEMPLMVGRCASAYDSCDEGIFHQRRGPLAKGFDAMLFWSAP